MVLAGLCVRLLTADLLRVFVPDPYSNSCGHHHCSHDLECERQSARVKGCPRLYRVVPSSLLYSVVPTLVTGSCLPIVAPLPPDDSGIGSKFSRAVVFTVHRHEAWQDDIFPPLALSLVLFIFSSTSHFFNHYHARWLLKLFNIHYLYNPFYFSLQGFLDF